MTVNTAHADPAFKPLADRAELSRFLQSITGDVQAQNYLLVGLAMGDGGPVARIIASDWSFDAIQLAGPALIARIAAHATTPGERACSITSETIGVMDAVSLTGLGQAEIYALGINVARQRYTLILSRSEPGNILADRLTEVQMRCCYEFCAIGELLAAAMLRAPLTPREHECLSWASEGKTSEEIALIMDVSANAANAAITLAMDKLGAANRVVAVANAIRGGIF